MNWAPEVLDNVLHDNNYRKRRPVSEVSIGAPEHYGTFSAELGSRKETWPWFAPSLSLAQRKIVHSSRFVRVIKMHFRLQQTAFSQGRMHFPQRKRISPGT